MKVDGTHQRRLITMDFIEIAKKRYSCRSYQDRKVEKEKVDKILEAAHVAPSGHNNQPFKLLVVQEEVGLRKIGLATKDNFAPLAIIVCAEPQAAWVRSYDEKNISDIDAAIVTDHMMLQATELGLASVWVCWFRPDVIRKEFNLPDHLEPVNILMIGYENENNSSPERHHKTRKPLADFVVKESF